MRFCCIKAFFIFCLCEALQSPQPKGYDQKNTTEEILKPRRTLSFTYSFARKPQTLEETIHEEIEDGQSNYEEKLLEDDPGEVPIAPIEQIVKVESDTTHLYKHLKRKKNKKNSKDSSNDEPKKGCKSKFKGTRLLRDPSAQITRASIVEALYNIESRIDANNLETALNIESGSQPIDEEELLESLLIALARRSRSSSSSRSKGKGKSKKRKKRSGSKGKGKSRSRSRSRSSKSRSRKSRKRGKSRSSRSESNSAFSKDVEDSNDFDPSENIENVFSDEFIDFLNDYYSTESTESASEDIDEQDTDSLDNFLETYYKFQESSNDGEVLLDDDLGNKSPRVVNPKAPSLSSSVGSAPSGNYRDPNGEFTSPTPPVSPTLPKFDDGDIFSDDTLVSKAPKASDKDPKMKSPSGGKKVEEGKEPKGTAPSLSDGKESKVKAPSSSKKKKGDEEGSDAEAKGIPSPSSQQVAPSSSKKKKGDEEGRDAEAKGIPSPSSQQVPKRVKKVKNSNGDVDVFNDDMLDDDSLETALKKSGTSSRKSSSSDGKDKSPTSSRKKQKKEKGSKKRQRKLRSSRR